MTSPIIRNEKVIKQDRSTFPRSLKQSQLAKIDSDWTCEHDSTHKTFNNKIDNKPFVEAHHLIPMSVQNEFIYSLDFSNNIVCLCPNCHRKIHHGTDNNRKIMIEKLFQDRKEIYLNHGINININELLVYYGIY